MAEEEGSRKSRVPFLCGVGSILIITVLLLTTEWLTDASVMLNTQRLIWLAIALIPFLLMSIDGGKAGDILSVVVFVAVLVLSASLYVDRNAVTRIYISGSEVSEAQAREIESMMERPIVVVIAGGVTKLPESLQKFNELSDEVYKRLHDRLKPHEAPSEDLDQKDLSANRMYSARLSGVKERLLLIMPSSTVTGDNYGKYGFNKMQDQEEKEGSK